jgi:hypothetical protein
MKLKLLFVIIVLSAAIPAFSQDATANAAEKEAAYTRTITSRAEKIVNNLKLQDAAKNARLVQIIAGQYRNLNGIHESKTDVEAKLATLHQTYLAQLSAELTPEQVDAVKDGMTYGVLPITYKGYQEMIPTLTNEQKQQIKTWLTEAREHAMDAESSEKKHWWFGKYKGRINNYLSSAGYDLKKEGDAWEKRRQDAKEKAKNQNKP